LRSFKNTDIEMQIPLTPDKELNRIYRKIFVFRSNFGGSRPCAGDSGGPLACRSKFTGVWVLIGVTSFAEENCAKLPTVFTRVSAFMPWIIRHINTTTTITTTAAAATKRVSAFMPWIIRHINTTTTITTAAAAATKTTTTKSTSYRSSTLGFFLLITVLLCLLLLLCIRAAFAHYCKL